MAPQEGNSDDYQILQELDGHGIFVILKKEIGLVPLNST